MIAISQLNRTGRGLNRPECVLGSPTGDIYVADWRGGVTVIRTDGFQHSWLAQDIGFDLRTNGFAFAPDGSFIIANLGDEGGVWRLSLDGEVTPIVTEIGGTPLPPANFPFVDQEGRLWVSVSTRQRPRQAAFRPGKGDGFVILVDRGTARIVADGLGYTNEIRVDPTGRWLYVVETFGRALLRFPIQSNGDLGLPERFASFGEGIFPDGFAFDAEGGVLVTSVISNQLICCTDDGRQEVVFSDTNPERLQKANMAFAGGTLGAEHLAYDPDREIQQLSSIAFGGEDLQNAYIGNLHDTAIHSFRSSTPGSVPPHWGYPLP